MEDVYQSVHQNRNSAACGFQLASISYFSNVFSSIIILENILGGVLRLLWTISVSMVTRKSSSSKYMLPLHTQSRFQVHFDWYTFNKSSSVKRSISVIKSLLLKINFLARALAQVLMNISTYKVINQLFHAFSCALSCFSINLLAFYYQCCSLIGYHTHYLFGDR